MAPVSPSGVLLTGASSGIGEATALHLDARGFTVFAGVRREADGRRLRELASERLVPVLLDVTDPGSVAGAEREVRGRAPEGLAGLVNNAGIAVAAPLEIVSLAEVRRQLEVNFVGALAVIQAFLPLVRAGSGRIVNVSSANGRIATPFLGPYSASKFALEAASDALRAELRRWRIPVSVIEPGAVATPLWERSAERGRESLREVSDGAWELYGGLIRALAERAGTPPRHAIPPRRVAETIARALTARRPRSRYLVGWDARLAALLALLPGRLRDLVLAR